MACDTYWLDTGTPEQFLEANLDVVTGKRSIDVGPVVRGQADPEARVVDSVIGEGCVVAAGAVVERSVLFDRCVVEAGASVCDSVLSYDVRVGSGATVSGQSVIGEGESIDSGAQLDGVRQPPPE
ncbi:MAG: NDP-sugar synthase, partial [Actinomycetota bacterium]|nr:NDP-sugar synthase [Actinomycetota bacterium]